MIIIGLTGSVGMGKTEVGKIFEKNNIKVFDCDAHIKALYENKKIIKKIKEYFPEAFFNEILNKKKLTKIVFKDDKKLILLENILHKKLRIKQALWVRKKYRERKQIIVFDVPLLFEKDNINKYDIIVVVSCSKEIQKQRVLKRDEWDEERLKKTIKHQFKDKIKINMADIVIKTDRGKRRAIDQVKEIIEISKFKCARTASKILFYF